jgi:hypothetical protein
LVKVASQPVAVGRQGVNAVRWLFKTVLIEGLLLTTPALAFLATGPGLAVTSPTGAVFDFVTYAGESDSSYMENADLLAHLCNATPSVAESWTWTITANGTSWGSIAAAFKTQ